MFSNEIFLKSLAAHSFRITDIGEGRPIVLIVNIDCSLKLCQQITVCLQKLWRKIVLLVNLLISRLFTHCWKKLGHVNCNSKILWGSTRYLGSTMHLDCSNWNIYKWLPIITVMRKAERLLKCNFIINSLFTLLVPLPVPHSSPFHSPSPYRPLPTPIDGHRHPCLDLDPPSNYSTTTNLMRTCAWRRNTWTPPSPFHPLTPPSWNTNHPTKLTNAPQSYVKNDKRLTFRTLHLANG